MEGSVKVEGVLCRVVVTTGALLCTSTVVAKGAWAGYAVQQEPQEWTCRLRFVMAIDPLTFRVP